VSVSFDELTSLYNLDELIEIFISIKKRKVSDKENTPFEMYEHRAYEAPVDALARTTPFLEQNVFKMKFSETNMMRYIQRLCEKDVSLTNTMIPLGSCTMKLNSAICMIPITWYGFANMHPFAPVDQAQGYMAMIEEIEDNLVAIT